MIRKRTKKYSKAQKHYLLDIKKKQFPGKFKSPMKLKLYDKLSSIKLDIGLLFKWLNRYYGKNVGTVESITVFPLTPNDS